MLRGCLSARQARPHDGREHREHKERREHTLLIRAVSWRCQRTSTTPTPFLLYPWLRWHYGCRATPTCSICPCHPLGLGLVISRSQMHCHCLKARRYSGSQPLALLGPLAISREGARAGTLHRGMRMRCEHPLNGGVVRVPLNCSAMVVFSCKPPVDL